MLRFVRKFMNKVYLRVEPLGVVLPHAINTFI
jgi:hypothetical protein